MIHPSGAAVGYIWEHFAETYFSKDTLRLIERIEKIRQAMQHRPFQPALSEHKAFRRAQLAATEQLQKEYPDLDLHEERAFFQENAR